jgi:hypothetical protein
MLWGMFTRRFVIQLRAGLLMMVVLLLAALTARAREAFALSAADTTWRQVLATTVVAGVCSLIVAWWRLRPAGSLIHIFSFAAVAAIPNQPPLWQGMLVAALTVALSLLIGISSRVIRSHRTPWVRQKPRVWCRAKNGLPGLSPSATSSWPAWPEPWGPWPVNGSAGAGLHAAGGAQLTRIPAAGPDRRDHHRCRRRRRRRAGPDSRAPPACPAVRALVEQGLEQPLRNSTIAGPVVAQGRLLVGGRESAGGVGGRTVPRSSLGQVVTEAGDVRRALGVAVRGRGWPGRALCPRRGR